jgi:predicted phage terminase large subunit-like protein
VTGFGADLILIDDVIKNAYEARNDNIKEQHYNWYNNTMLSRREGKRKVIIIMTRWATDDLAGRVMDSLSRQGKQYRLICYKAFDGSKMLCEDILNYQQYQDILNGDIGKDIVEANYNQSPIDITGRLYTELKTYDELPDGIESVESYTDTADEGADYLCSIIYAIKDCIAYVLDVIYTQEGMEVTENLVAKAFTDYNVNYARIESNNGGRGFGRNVKRIAKEEYGNNLTRYLFFTQTKNKASRILTGSTGVMNNIRFPADWHIRFPEYYRDMIRYQRMGKNAHDDAQDATTGVYEYLPKKNKTTYQSVWW